MGKRRKEGPHADKYTRFDEDDDDDDEEIEEENNLEKEPLKPDEIASIKSRKKLIATRRVAANGNGNLVSAGGSSFSPFSGFNAITTTPVSTEVTIDNKPSVFSGFKGFNAFKPSVPSITVNNPVTINGKNDISKSSEIPKFSTNTTTPNLFSNNISASITVAPVVANTTTSAISSSNFNPSFSDSSSSSCLFQSKSDTSKTTKNLLKPSENSNSSINKSTESSVNNNLNHSNISDLELNFMNDLNELYERYYGNNKRAFSLPTDTLNGDFFDDSDELKDKKSDESDESKKKYAYLLAELNNHCSKWISKHVEENPLVILTPVFVDYFAYLILLEKNYFPSTFNKKESTYKNNNSTKQLNGSKINGTTSEPSAPIIQFNSTEKNGTETTDSHKHMNGFKFGVTQSPAKENLNGNNLFNRLNNEKEEEKKDDNNLEQSSKTFASLIKTQTSQFNPISLNAPTTTTSAFSFKPMVNTENKINEPDSKKETVLPSSTSDSGLFKFGVTNTNSFKLNNSSEATKTNDSAPSSTPTAITTTTTLPKLFNTTATPSFKFGDINKTTSPTNSNTTTTTTATSQPTPSLFSKETVSESQPATTGGFFSNLNKNPVSSTSTFSSLLNSSTTTNVPNVFKPFSSLETQPASTTTTTSSIFSSLSNTNTPGSVTPFFGFQSNLNSKTSIFGSNSTFGSGETPNTNSLFTNAAANPSAEGGEADEEEYEPPKPEVSDMKEDGSVYNKRIKLYYFNEQEKKFCDKGIGNLYLKPISNGESTQLIIRADNTLANILLNVKLSKLFPITKIGAKDVSYICVPNPPIPNIDSKTPCKFLFKVKTGEDATELLDKLNELKK